MVIWAEKRNPAHPARGFPAAEMSLIASQQPCGSKYLKNTEGLAGGRGKNLKVKNLRLEGALPPPPSPKKELRPR